MAMETIISNDIKQMFQITDNRDGPAAEGQEVSFEQTIEGGETHEKKQIYTYESEWNLYAFNFSNKPERDFRLSLGSFIEDT